MTAPSPTLDIRPVDPPADYPEVAALLTAADPEWPVTADLLAQWRSQQDPTHFRLELLAFEDGRLVGLGATGEDRFTAEADKYWVDLVVHPEARGRGVGAALYARLEDVWRERGARKVGVQTREDKADGVRFAQKQGFAETWRRYESRLDTRDFDFAPFAHLEDAVRERGLQIVPVRDFAGTEERDRQLYELDWILFQDVPMGVTFQKQPYEQWRKRRLDNPNFLHDASFVVLDPARNHELSGPLVGWSTLDGGPNPFLVIGMTGVLREYRGLGLAKLMKLRGTRWAQENGGREIRTFNDPPNTAMLGMNAALGFVRQPTHLRFEKEFGAPETA